MSNTAIPYIVSPVGILPVGGNSGDNLVKNSATDFDTKWVAPNVVSAGAGGSVSNSTTLQQMSGNGVYITPRKSGILIASWYGRGANSVANQWVGIQAYYGTGTKPAANAAQVGTAMGVFAITPSGTAAGSYNCWSILNAVGGFALGTQYWFDVAFYPQAGSQTATIIQYTPVVWEL